MYAAQAAALFHPARYVVVEASTKAGKTVGALIWLIEQAALRGGPGRSFWWVAPTRFQARIAYRRLKQYLPRGTFQTNETEMRVELANGAAVVFLTSSQPDYLYGEDVHGLVIDEATRVAESSWWALRSTITATRAPVRIIGNVKGTDNWVYELARKAERGEPDWHYCKLTAWDAVAGGVLARSEIEDARRMLPSEVFAELYLAQASSRARYFSGTPMVVDFAPRAARVVRGWDFAASEVKPGRDPDWTAGAKLAQHQGLTYVVEVRRKREAPDVVLEWFVRTARNDRCDQVIEQERGSAGKLLVAQLKSKLREAGVAGQVHGVTPTGDKTTRAYMLSATWNDGSVRLVDGPWLGEFLDEVDYFPHGKHDDMVDASAHAFNHLQGLQYLTGGFRLPGDTGTEGTLQGMAEWARQLRERG